jgi:four helix bundle protein
VARIQAERTLSFAVDVLRFVGTLPKDARGWEVGKQLIRCGTSIGANVREADNALTERDFTSKVSIARKEAAEAVYWLELVARADLSDGEASRHLRQEADELARVLATIVMRMHERRGKGDRSRDKGRESSE